MLFENVHVILMLILTASLVQGSGKRHIIYWDGSIMPELQREMKIDVRINDWMDILCPHKANYNSSSRDTSLLYLELFNVSAEQYKHCGVLGQRRILRCKDPRKETKLTTKFQKRSPSPIGFVFRPGKSYYYISKPSTKQDSGCDENTMRLVIKVQEENYYHQNPGHPRKDPGASKDIKSSDPHRNSHHIKDQFNKNKKEKDSEIQIVSPQASRHPSPSGGNDGNENMAQSVLKSKQANLLLTFLLCVSVMMISLVMGEPYA
ncbi:ephrin-A1-like [Clavelina lepadiformis]|uniref:ephrin-A1-like n=1 Tax=Clavelina lepadiformis TaxID=159417 RepID=UPI0040432CDC